jgi:cell division protein FtsX
MELIKEAAFETYFMQAIIKIEKKKSNNTEVYNQVRGIQDVIVVKVINNEQVEALSDNNYDYALLEIKFINEGTPEQTISMIKEKALKILGLVKFFPRAKSLVKIRNY